MTVPTITAARLGGSPRLPLLVLGPSLGTSAQTLWAASAPVLAQHFEVLAWDLPGHGTNTAATAGAFDIRELAAGVLGMVDDLLAERGTPGASFCYAGVSLGGAVGLELMLAAPRRVASAVLICTGAKIGDPPQWAERASSVRRSGTAVLVEGSAQRWFAPGFAEREPQVVSRLLRALSDADDGAYAQACEALASYDVRERLRDVDAPVLAVAGSQDGVTPPASLEEIAQGVRDGRLVVLDGVSHLAPAAEPARVADLIVRHVSGQALPSEALPGKVRSGEAGSGGAPSGEPAATDPYAAGLAVRREVLGDEHVDRAEARTTDLTRDFQHLITEYAFGSVWTRPGLDRRSRSMITLTALVALGHHEELALHLRAARTNGLTDAEITEVLLQSAIYCGVPAANTAFRIAQQVLVPDE